MGVEYLWGAPVRLETSEVVSATSSSGGTAGRSQWPVHSRREVETREVTWRRVVYTMEKRKLSKLVKG